MSGSDRVWDLAVVGGGTAGIVAARTAAGFGARVLLVERSRTGGDCLWTGCVPSKALLAAAHRVADARRGDELGVRVGEVAVDFAAVMAHVKDAIATVEPEDSPASLEAAGVRVVLGEARFTGPDRIAVDGRTVRFRRAVVATGAAPAVPPIPGLREAQPLTSDSVWGLDVLPARLLVLGGGAIGCELGQAFARLGSQVTLVEALPRILPAEDPDAAAVLSRVLEDDGVRVLAGHGLAEVRGDPVGAGEAVLDGADGRITVGYDHLLVAVGRSPATRSLRLHTAGVAVDDRGFLEVADTLRTSNPRIWAAGDVTPLPAFTHTAGVHGSLAATNAVLGLRRKIDLSAVPRVTYTDPEVAAVGEPTWAEEGEPTPRTTTRVHERVDRAVAERRTEGFARLVLGRRSRVLGATVVGPRAGETLAELTLAVRKGLSTSDLAGTIHPYPTYVDGPWNAAIGDVRARLAAPLPRLVTRAAVRLRRLGA